MAIEDNIRKGFPNLKKFNIIETEYNPVYNCIAYAMSDKTRYWWPIGGYWLKEANFGITLRSFYILFELHNYISCQNNYTYEEGYEKVALFFKNNIPTHACRQKDNNWWISKLGPHQLIEHNLFELQGQEYGIVCEIFKRKI